MKIAVTYFSKKALYTEIRDWEDDVPSEFGVFLPSSETYRTFWEGLAQDDNCPPIFHEFPPIQIGVAEIVGSVAFFPIGQKNEEEKC